MGAYQAVPLIVAMAASAADFLQSFETQTAQRAAVERETHTEVSERLRDRDLLGLMSIHSSVGFPFEEDPLGILPLVPETFNSSSASYIENLGGDAASCADQCRQFGSSAEETLTNLFHMCNEDSLADLRVNLRRQLSHERAAVQKTQTAIARVQNKSLTEALGHYLGECNLSWVNEDEKGAKYDEMQSELHDSHVKSTREAALRLLESSTLPFPHDAIHAQQKDAESLQQKADGLPSWRRAVTEARARLAEQQADTRVKRQRCASLRRISRREVAAKRQALEQAEKTRQRTWQEYLDAYIRDEAVFMTEAGFC